MQKNITNGLLNARLEYGLTKEFVARKTNISVKDISLIEENILKDYDINKLQILANLYGLTKEDDVFSCKIETPKQTFIARNSKRISDNDINQIRKLYKLQAALG